jgi:hypothetical protein
MKLKALIAGVAGSFAISTAAIAADPIFIAPPPPPPMVVAPAGFDWSGPYAGAGILYAGALGFGGQAGFNLVRGNAVFGGEVWIAFNGGDAIAGAVGKIGFTLGATDRILAYASGGIATDFGAFAFVVAAGSAIALSDRLSLFAEGLLIIGETTALRAGVNFHFGN